jgi:hypothetical protein
VVFATQSHSEQIKQYKAYTITVEDVDGLYGIVGREYDTKNNDIRKIVYEIVQKNDLRGSKYILRAGQEIDIPIY